MKSKQIMKMKDEHIVQSKNQGGCCWQNQYKGDGDPNLPIYLDPNTGMWWVCDRRVNGIIDIVSSYAEGVSILKQYNNK